MTTNTHTPCYGKSSFSMEGCLCYKLLGQTVLDIMNGCFKKDYIYYSPGIKISIHYWIGFNDPYKAQKLLNFLNYRLLSDISMDEMIRCHWIDDLAKLVNKHINYFFSEKCNFCIDM